MNSNANTNRKNIEVGRKDNHQIVAVYKNEIIPFRFVKSIKRLPCHIFPSKNTLAEDDIAIV